MKKLQRRTKRPHKKSCYDKDCDNIKITTTKKGKGDHINNDSNNDRIQTGNNYIVTKGIGKLVATGTTVNKRKNNPVPTETTGRTTTKSDRNKKVAIWTTTIT